MKKKNIVLFIFFGLSLFSCDPNKLKEVPVENFIGTWEIHGRKMFEGIRIKIEKNEKGIINGKVLSINGNKYVKFFVEPGDIWVSNISRLSNYQFRLTEKKMGSVLFGLYGLDTSEDFNVQFIDHNTIGLAKENVDPLQSSIKYIRVD